LIALAVVVAVVTIALLANAPKQEPVKVWFVRATNEGGVKKLVFEGTNGMTHAITYFACVSTNSVRYARIPDSWGPYYDSNDSEAASGQSFTFALKAPPKEIAYSLAWTFYERGRPTMRVGTFGIGCYNFFRAHGMPALARRFEVRPDVHYIPSTEIKE